MLLVETIEHINNELIAHYGRENIYPRYRVVFSDDQVEKRWVTHTREGWQLIHPEVQERWKYRQYIQGKYILERFLDIPPGVVSELIENFSYEPVWVFQDNKGIYLPPRFSACKYVIDSLHEASKKAVGVKYRQDEDDPKIAREVQEAKIKKLEEELFGNESEIADALHYREAVVKGDSYGTSISSSSANVEEKDDKSTSKSTG